MRLSVDGFDTKTLNEMCQCIPHILFAHGENSNDQVSSWDELHKDRLCLHLQS